MLLPKFLQNSKKITYCMIYTNNSQPFPAKINTRSSKTTFIIFHTNYDYGAGYRSVKTYVYARFLTKYPVMISEHLSLMIFRLKHCELNIQLFCIKLIFKVTHWTFSFGSVTHARCNNFAEISK